MRKQLEEILNKDIGEIIKSSDSLILLDLASKLLLNGCQPGFCEKSQRTYYTLLKEKGIELLTQYEKIMTSTCKLKGSGLRHYHAYGFVQLEKITDEQAVDMLSKKLLSIDEFDVLPAGYLKPEPEKVKRTYNKKDSEPEN